MNETIEDIYEDVEYFKSLYPRSVYPLYKIISDYSDQLEYEGSVMYDEYPDQERLTTIVGQMVADINRDVTEFPTREEFIAMLVLNEFLHRRIRKREFMQNFDEDTSVLSENVNYFM